MFITLKCTHTHLHRKLPIHKMAKVSDQLSTIFDVTQVWF